MVPHQELNDYVQQARAALMSDEDICARLLESGWSMADIEEALHLGPAIVSGKSTVNKSRRFVSVATVATICLLVVIVGLGGVVALLWHDRIDLTQTNNAAVRHFFVRLAEGSVGFTDAGDLVFPDDKKFFDAKQQFIQEKKSFVEADLTAMKLRLYEEGVGSSEFPILSKGKEGSWWETPTGSYLTLKKEQNHFSSIGEVWMPWSIQFYGNFFIHGWPYYSSGEVVPAGYSGGCIRLSTEDAKVLYQFMTEGMPILVRESNGVEPYGSVAVREESVAPSVSANSFLIANLSTGEPILEKLGGNIVPIASLTKLMTAVVTTELVYLERSILVRNDLLAAAIARFEPKVGDRYLAFDLLYPLLMQSSNQAATILGGFLEKGKIVTAMNEKAVSLGMSDTRFEDASGISKGNISSADDLLKLLQYIYFKRHFLLAISKGESYQTYSGMRSTTLANFNEFASDSRLVGMKNGETTAAKQTLASVWEFESPSGPVPVAIIVLGSDDRQGDTKALLNWVEKNVKFE